MRNLDIVYHETGVVRAPMAGEWFRGYKGFPVQARSDFECQKFPILEMEVVEIAPEPVPGDGVTS